MLIEDVEVCGVLKVGMYIVELISGNIGIVLVFVVVVKGYVLILIMLLSMSIECCKVMKVLGVNLVFIDFVKGMCGVVEEV